MHSKLSKRIKRHMRKQGNVAQSNEKSKFPETNSKEGEIYKFLLKEFKLIFLKLQENTANYGKSGTMHEQNGNLNIELETLKKRTIQKFWN